jgi:RNA polymerase I-specific transcription initiation factor RRN7
MSLDRPKLLRLPIEPNDPACALPRIDEYLRLVKELNDVDSKQRVELFSSRGSM